jgi:hypothetical protein
VSGTVAITTGGGPSVVYAKRTDPSSASFQSGLCATSQDISVGVREGAGVAAPLGAGELDPRPPRSRPAPSTQHHSD